MTFLHLCTEVSRSDVASVRPKVVGRSGRVVLVKRVQETREFSSVSDLGEIYGQCSGIMARQDRDGHYHQSLLQLAHMTDLGITLKDTQAKTRTLFKCTCDPLDIHV